MSSFARGRVIVGVDSPYRSQPAIETAVAEARRLGTGVTIVHAVDEPMREPVRQRQEQEARLLVSESLAGWREKHPDVIAEERTMPAIEIEGAMVNASSGAAVMVVGSRGRGGFMGLALGSVSQALLHHAHCPVLVARA
jgi:nucleotide-binding universal stress UspA family protein